MAGAHSPLPVHVLVVEAAGGPWYPRLRAALGEAAGRAETLREAVRFALAHHALEVLVIPGRPPAAAAALLEDLRRVRPELPVLVLGEAAPKLERLVDDFLPPAPSGEVVAAVRALLAGGPYA